MSNKCNYFRLISFSLTYALLLRLAYHYAAGLKLLQPSYWLLILVAAPLLLSTLIRFLISSETSSCAKRFLPFLGFVLLQGAVVGFALYSFFHLPWKTALTFSGGALAALLLLSLIWPSEGSSLSLVLITLLLGAGFTLALRGGQIFGGLLFTLALLNSLPLGSKVFKSSPALQQTWLRCLTFAGLLAIGRSLLQLFLLKSGNEVTGVIISQPYTFILLFLGILLPIAVALIEKDRSLPGVIVLILGGILLPAALPAIFSVRPTLAFIMGFIISSFCVGIFMAETLVLSILTWFAVGIPLGIFYRYETLLKFTKVQRLEILGGLLAASLILIGLGLVLKGKITQPKT